MVYLKNHRKYKVEALTNNTTDNLELSEAGVVSAIQLVFSALSAAGIQSNNKARIIDHVTKIELTDGGTKTMFSLTGQLLKALDFYHLGKVMPESAPLYGGFTQRTEVVIPFGAYIGDPRRALDLGAWDEVDLEITNDATTAMWAAGALNVDVNIITLEDIAARPTEYYKHYLWKSESPKAAGQHVYHKIPTTDYVRRLMTQIDPTLLSTGTATNNENTDSNNVKFTFLEGKEVVWDHRPKDVFRANAAIYGQPRTRARYFPSLTQYADLAIGYVESIHGAVGNFTSGDGYTDIPVIEDNNLRFTKWGSIGLPSASSDSGFMDLEAVGDGYYDTMILFDAMSEDQAYFLNPASAGKGPVEIDWYGANTDHTFRTCLTVPQKQGEA